MPQLTITGTIDGVNTRFTLSSVPGFLELFKNGLLQTPGVDYTLASNIVTFFAGSIPQPADGTQAADRLYAIDVGAGSSAPGGSTGAAVLNADLLYAALRKAGVQATPGRGPGPAQIKDALMEENRMIGGWNLSQLVILNERIDLWNTIPNQQSYTIGQDPTGNRTADWNGERPQKIIRANLLLPTANDPIQKVRRGIDIYDARQWAEIVFQGVATYPAVLFPLFNDPQNTPFTRIYFRPIPDAIYQIELITWQRVPKFVSAGDAVLLPDGLEDAIVNNLAVRLASMPWTFQVPMNPQVRVDAQQSLAMIQQFNATPPRLKTEWDSQGGEGYYNYHYGLTR
jgi:hypothetical protein